MVRLGFRFVVPFMRALRILPQRLHGKRSPVCMRRINKLCYYRLACVIKSLFPNIQAKRGRNQCREKDFTVFNSHKQCQSAMLHWSRSSSVVNLLMTCTAASCYDLTILYVGQTLMADTAISVCPAPPYWAKTRLYLYCKRIYGASLLNGNMALY